MQFFRPAALQARHASSIGAIVLIRPLSFTFLTLCATACACCVVLFLLFGTYTKRSTVTGQLVPDVGVVKVLVPQPGIVLSKHVDEGQRVERGATLYVLSSERQSSTQGDVQAAISEQVGRRQSSLQDEVAKTRRLQQEDRNALTKKIDGLDTELAKIDSLLESQRSRISLAADAVSRAQELVGQNFISKEQLQQRQADLLDQRTRLQALERDRISTARERSSAASELTSLPIRYQTQLAQLERQLSSNHQELTESEARRRLVISAPEAGIATAVAAEIGQSVDVNKPLLTIVPQGARLQAHLYAASRAIGFIKPGDAVLLRYPAFPYQKFGHATGQVIHVSRTSLPANELAANGSLANPGQATGEPLYRITVALARQTILAYGKQQPLQAGMQIEADVLQEKRFLYEWVLEPLYSLSGKL
jgi:membrane fusion protein